jgi:hypothetical protein
VINAAEAESLAQFNISKGRVGNILKYRSRKGPFREVEELLEVDGFGVKVRRPRSPVLFAAHFDHTLTDNFTFPFDLELFEKFFHALLDLKRFRHSYF